MTSYPDIHNVFGERLSTMVEGNEQAKATIIFVHGFATDMHETARYFDDLAVWLGEEFRILRFDFSGCGKSDGNLSDKDYEKWTNDLKHVIAYTKEKYQGELYILAQSMGCFITAMLNPQGISKTAFTGLPNSNTNYLIDRLVERFGSKEGAKIDMENISLFPRSSGNVQKVGPTFWRVLRLFKPAKAVAEFSKNTRLMIVHPNQDEIVGQVYLAQYASIPGVIIKKLNGDHSFKNQEDRRSLYKKIKEFFTSSGQ